MEYLQALKVAFEENTDPARAAGAKRYMRNISEFYGIDSPKRRELLLRFLGESGLPKIEQLPELVYYAWDQPQREWQYIAMEITARLARKAGPGLLELATFMITHKSWWDSVDFISPNIAGVVLKKYPELIPDQVEAWMQSGNMWLQRTCLLFQMKYRMDTDKDLLFSLCVRLSGHKDFFIRKAIGWSLREYSKRNPTAVLEFVNTHTISALSFREAVKRITL
jgi:3-methyladenine DNA glycosylase AlkD